MGVAKQRKAIMDGLRESVKDFNSNVPGTSAKEVLDLLMLTNYFDVLATVGNNPCAYPGHGHGHGHGVWVVLFLASSQRVPA